MHCNQVNFINPLNETFYIVLMWENLNIGAHAVIFYSSLINVSLYEKGKYQAFSAFLMIWVQVSRKG